ncbi:MAG: glycosyltransferase family 2 protein [Ornithinimicrobium sp.]|uniref:glycosyltransferase family 2 protein n=1 Tax=Ornithinimicrobium sp. TaxID=1977084 RepID=UPI003D9B0F1D
MSARTGVVTIAQGRHGHLAGQLCGLARQVLQPDVYVAVAMDDPGIADVVVRHAQPNWDVTVASVASSAAGLPLAAARNAGARAAIDAGAQTLVFLDVDCIPSPTLVQQYVTVLGRRGGSPSKADRPVVASGDIGYLPPVPDPLDYWEQDLARLARPHPARPALGVGEVRVAEDLRLFWSLSFALDVSDWDALGGFCEDYVGYGGEDTDFGQRLGAAQGRMLWVGGATAYHQHHPSESPPVQHLDAIVANANRFHQRWGWFPMEGWLERFAAMGLAEVEGRTGEWRVLRPEAAL